MEHEEIIDTKIESPADVMQLKEQLATHFARMTASPSAPAPVSRLTNPGATVWVVKWVDYSNRYGLGYQLSDGSIGVYFNDATKIVSPTGTKYVEQCICNVMPERCTM